MPKYKSRAGLIGRQPIRRKKKPVKRRKRKNNVGGSISSGGAIPENIRNFLKENHQQAILLAKDIQSKKGKGGGVGAGFGTRLLAGLAVAGTASIGTLLIAKQFLLSNPKIAN